MLCKSQRLKISTFEVPTIKGAPFIMGTLDVLIFSLWLLHSILGDPTSKKSPFPLGLISMSRRSKGTIQELVFNCFSLHTHSLSHTQPLQLKPTINTRYKRLNKITIKFGTKLKSAKHIVVNYNFTEWSLSKKKIRICGMVIVYKTNLLHK